MVKMRNSGSRALRRSIQNSVNNSFRRKQQEPRLKKLLQREQTAQKDEESLIQKKDANE